MAVLNLNKKDFILFASFSESFRVTEIVFSSEYSRNMLTYLKDEINMNKICRL